MSETKQKFTLNIDGTGKERGVTLSFGEEDRKIINAYVKRYGETREDLLFTVFNEHLKAVSNFVSSVLWNFKDKLISDLVMDEVKELIAVDDPELLMAGLKKVAGHLKTPFEGDPPLKKKGEGTS